MCHNDIVPADMMTKGSGVALGSYIPSISSGTCSSISPTEYLKFCKRQPRVEKGEETPMLGLCDV